MDVEIVIGEYATLVGKDSCTESAEWYSMENGFYMTNDAKLAQSTKESIAAFNELLRPKPNLCCVLSTDRCKACSTKICKECDSYPEPRVAGNPDHLCRLCYIKNFLPYRNHPRITIEKKKKG